MEKEKMKPEFRKTRYSVITRREEYEKIISYCSMGNQKFYAEHVCDLDKIKKGYLKVIKLHEDIMKEDTLIGSLETKLEVNFK